MRYGMRVDITFDNKLTASLNNVNNFVYNYLSFIPEAKTFRDNILISKNIDQDDSKWANSIGSIVTNIKIYGIFKSEETGELYEKMIKEFESDDNKKMIVQKVYTEINMNSNKNDLDNLDYTTYVCIIIKSRKRITE